MSAVYAAPRPVITDGDRLSVTLFFAICAHLIVVLGISFVNRPAPQLRTDTMDVILVQRQSRETPEQVEFLAQASQDGGGQNDAVLRPSTPLPSPLLSELPELVASAPPALDASPVEAPPQTPVAADTLSPPPPAQSVAAVLASEQVASDDQVPVLDPTLRRLREPPVDARAERAESRPEPTTPTTVRSARAEPEPVPAPVPETTRNPVRSLDAATLVRRSLAMASLSAELDRRLEAYAKRPRRKWISARTREHAYAAYMEAWRAKVERVGNLNYPDEARRRQLSGSLLLDVALNADGTVREIIVRRSSGHRVLDDAAIRIVRLASPFARFPAHIRKQTDILHIERTWRFLTGNRFASR